MIEDSGGFVVAILRHHAFHFTNERDLQDGIALVLAEVPGVRREYICSPRDRLDFLLPGGVGIEVKVDGSLQALTRQLHRYAERPEITALIVVTSRRSHMQVPTLLCGKPVTVVQVGTL